MTRKVVNLQNILLLIIFHFFVFFNLSVNASPSKKLTIFAEPNLAPSLIEIARSYSGETSSIVAIEYGASSGMIARVEDGEDSDLFISSHKNWHDILKQKGLVDIYNINHFADDYLVIVTSPNNKNLPKEFIDSNNLSFENALLILNKGRLDLISDNSTTSLGQHTKSLLNTRKLRSVRLFKKLPEDISTAEDIISKNPNIYGIMLNSQIHNNKNFKIIAKDKVRAIFYQALIIAGDNMDNARRFSNFLKSKQSQEILRKNGFVAIF